MVTSYELQKLVQEFCGETGRKRRNLEAKLAVQIPNLNGLAKVNNYLYFDDYNELLNDVVNEVLQTVCTEFDPNQSNLATWINEIKRLKYQVLELYPLSEKDKSRSHALGEEPPELSPNSAKRQYNASIRQSLKRPDSFNRIMGKRGSQETDASYEYFLASPTLSDLEVHIEVAQNGLAEANFNPVQKLIAYLETDPDQILQNRVPKDKNGNSCPACNDHEVVKFLYLELLKEGRSLTETKLRGKITKLASQHNIDYQALYSRIQHPNRPSGTVQNFILGFGLEFGLISNQLKPAIEEDPDGQLSNCAIKNHPECNCLYLAKRRLSLFASPPLSFESITKELNDAHGYNLKARQIERHWQTRCYPRLGHLAATLGYKTFSNAGVES